MLKLLGFVTFAVAILSLLSDEKHFTGIKFKQTDYKLTFERVELARYDKRYFKYASIVTFKYNRTCPVVNATFMANVNLGDDWEIIVQSYKFVSNEYRIFPMRFQINFCEAMSKNVIGIASFKERGNFTGCPISKNKAFYFCNWTPNGSMLPPFIPNGQYMLELQGLYFGAETGLVRGYGTVTRPIVKE